MGNLTLNGATSGQITLAPPSVAGTNTISLPAQTATVLTDSSAAMNIGSGQIYKDASGNVGIGTTTPSKQLEVSKTGKFGLGNTIGTAAIEFTHSDASALVWQLNSGISGVTHTSMSIGSTSNPTMVNINSSGNLLVGTTSGAWAGKLSVASDSSGSFYPLALNNTASGSTSYPVVDIYRAGTRTGTISNTNTATAYNTSSDYRLKENVQPMTTGLATIVALKPVTYDWIIDKSKGEGFIAHELQEVVPLAVTGEKDAVDENGNINPQGVDYSKIVVHLVAAMQEQQSIIEDLKARLAVLEAK